MAFEARLDLDSLSDIRVISFSYSLSRDVDHTGRPSGGIRGGTIDLTIESTKDTTLFEWITDPTVRKSGTIKIMDEANPGASMKDLEFEDAYITNYNETFSWHGGENMVESFSLSAKKIIIGGGEHENEWPE